MTKGSDNDFPSILVTEQGSAPTSPAASHQRLYIRTSDHTLVTVNSSGTVTQVGTGGAAGTVTAHGCKVRRASGNVSVGNNTLTAIGFDSEDYDTDTMHDTVTNNTRITIPTISGVTTGLWTIKASGYTNATTRLDAMFRSNAAANPASGTSLAFNTYYANNTVNGFHLSTDVVLTAADYIELFVRSTGATGQVTFDATGSPMMTVAFLGKVT